MCLAVLLTTVTPGVHAERLPIRIYTTADGLAHNSVSRIVKDSRGFLWLCTVEGLSRFDGYSFRNFGTDHGLPHAAVADFLETRNGEHWVATRGGLVRFNPEAPPSPNIVNYAASDLAMFMLLPPEGGERRARATSALTEGADGSIWVGTNDGLFRVTDEGGRRFLRPVDVGLPGGPQDREIGDVVEDATGSLWIAAPSGLYRRWPDGRAARYTSREGLPSDHVSDLFVDRKGQLWAATRTSGFFRVHAGAGTTPATFGPAQREGPSNRWVSDLFETSDGRFWVASGSGLLEYFPDDGSGRRFRRYAARQGVSDLGIETLSEDLAGNLWLGTGADGAMKLTRGGFSTYGASDWIQTVNAAFEDQSGRVCFKARIVGDAHSTVFDGALIDPVKPETPASHARFGCFDGERFRWFLPAAVGNLGWVMERNTLRARSGDWWIGAGDGLYRFAPTATFADLSTARPLAVYRQQDGLDALQVFRLFEDSAGNVWISTASDTVMGLARWQAVTNRVQNLAGSPGLSALHHDWCARSFGEDRAGNVWIGFDGELARYKDGMFTLFTAADGLPPGAIKDIHVDAENRVWLASALSGLIRVHDNGAGRPTFTSFTTRTGLSSNALDVITRDREGHLYLGGGRGIDRFNPVTESVKRFSAADGVAPGLLLAAFQDRHGVLWFGSTNGLLRMMPAAESPRKPPPVLINAVRVLGQPQRLSALGEQTLSLADLAPDENQIEIDVVGLGFGSGEAMRYQYRLGGAETGWGALTAQRTMTYASLAPGRYTFAVRAVSADGLESLQPAIISFRILPPLWQRWWFLSLAIVLTGFIVHTLYRSRLSRLLEVAHMRTHIATDLHDDIGANLTRIALLSEMARHTGEQDSLGSIARIARESVSSMSDIVWAINPQRESLLDLTRRMRQHAGELFTSRGIALRFEAPAARTGLRLSMDVRRDLLLTFKEAVNNTARHSRCTAVEIDLRLEGSVLVLVVSDNGVGFAMSGEAEGQGLASMGRRARRIKGQLELESSPDTGTRVTLRVPV